MTTLSKIIIVLSILLFLIWHPFTRKVIFIILPLGKGWDDLLFWIVLVILIFISFVKGWVKLPKIKKYFEKLQEEENEN